MSTSLWHTLKLSPAVLSAVIIAANGAVAAENSAKPLLKDDTANVSDLSVGTSLSQLNSELAALPTSDVTVDSPNLDRVAQNSELGNEPAANNTLDQIDQYTQEPAPAVQSMEGTQGTEGLDQVTSVSQLRDVDPTSWAFQALQSLVERYGCIEGYPDRTFRGNRAMTRYEFAAGLNSCLDRIQELIAALPGGVSREDLDRLRRLQEEFAAELATLRGRVDALEARVTEVEANQFSTTTKLRGEVIFGVASVFGDDRAVPSGRPQTYQGLEDNAIFGYRARLNFDASFTGKDLLRIRLQARNFTSFSGDVTGTNMTRLSFDGDTGGNVEVDDLYYRFPLGNIGRAFIVANSGEFNDLVTNFHPGFESSGSGAISRFGRFNPLYRPNDGGVGAAVNLNFGAIGVDLAYLALNGSSPLEKNGLFDGSYTAFGQLVLFPKGSFSLGLTYTHSYFPGSRVNLLGSTGSDFARRPFGNIATFANSYGAEATWRPSKYFQIAGWFGYTDAQSLGQGSKGSDAEIINYAVSLGFPDLGKPGNFLGLLAGVPPRVTDNDFTNREDDDTSYHLEAFYRFRVSSNISITPGAFVILNPEHNDDNDTIWVGVIRTTFTF
ncbi:iron uptake porin [Aerosakkonemataceae cyanobacterium BLCC-F154]|uniref:Iron uptake porin n=1 Tax=Floridaenema fluviatile BLCC-F154 TaxID=3153640 RepID=A0ABV4YCG3_9CYAN